MLSGFTLLTCCGWVFDHSRDSTANLDRTREPVASCFNPQNSYCHPMEWHFEQNGKPTGPVSDSQLEELVRVGTVTHATLVWHAGLEGWRPYGTLRPVTTQPPSLAAPTVSGQGRQERCAECGRVFPADDMLFLNNTWICAQCKPVFIQKLKEGMSVGRLNLWRQGRTLVMRLDAVLPDRCVKCNAPVNGAKLPRNIYWHHPGLFLLIFLNLLIYVIVALIVRKRAKISVGICEKHRSIRMKAIAAAWLLALLGIGLLVGGIVSENGWLVTSSIILLLAGFIYGVVRGRIVTPRRIDKEHVWLNGVCAEYLENLPDWNG